MKKGCCNSCGFPIFSFPDYQEVEKDGEQLAYHKECWKMEQEAKAIIINNNDHQF